MSTTLKLDASAVALLMEQDPDFKLELQRAVIAQFTRQIYEKDVSTDARKLITECFKGHQDDLIHAVKEDENLRKQYADQLSALVQSIRTSSYSYATTRVLSPETKNTVAAHVGELLRTEIFKHEEALPAKIKAGFDDLEKKYAERIEKRLGTLDHDFAVEMRKQITADVTRRISESLTA